MIKNNENEKEIYDIIASLPLDFKKISLLNDSVFEAQLLLRSRFVTKIELDFSKFLNIKEYNKYGEILLITEVEGKRFVVYIEGDKISSVAYSEPKSGYRYAGVRALALLLQLLKLKPISFKMFELMKEYDDKTREVPHKIVKQSVQKVESVPVLVKRDFDKPVSVLFAEKLSEFQKKARALVEELSNTYGCQLIDFKLMLSKGVIIIEISVKKKLLSKCKADDLRKNIMKDLELLLNMHDLAFPIRVEVSIRK